MEQIHGMSDLFMYELEDIVWDEFDGTDDRIVSHQNGNELAFKGDHGNISQTEIALSFYNNITNYDDVEGIFSCDSMFGNESWLASSHNIEGSEDGPIPNFMFSCLESSMLKENDEPNALGDWTFVNDSNPISESTGQFTREEIIFHENEGKLHIESEGQSKEQCLQNELSPEASSFHHLQQVMEQLDTSTKLCLRDSLYRLARSAEQRHDYANLNGGSIGDRDTGSAKMDEGTNGCNGLMDIETDTNPIDRSISHLLFHRPTDSSVMPTLDDFSLKPNTTAAGEWKKSVCDFGERKKSWKRSL